MTFGNAVPWVVSGLLVVLAGFEWQSQKTEAVNAATARMLLAHSDSARKAAERRADSAERAFQIDSVVVTHDVIRNQILHDTVVRHMSDTVLVKEYIAQADTTIKACTATLHDCETVQAGLRAELTADDLRVLALTRQAKGPLIRFGADAGYYVIGGVGTPEIFGTATLGRFTALGGGELYSGRVLGLYGVSVRVYP